MLLGHSCMFELYSCSVVVGVEIAKYIVLACNSTMVVRKHGVGLLHHYTN